MKRFIFSLLLGLLILSLTTIGFAATTIKLWTAPNPNQNLFWKTLIPEWEKTHPDIKIEWSQIPASGSSEEAILNAIASGKQPDLCTNIFGGFAAELIESKVVVPFDSFKGFSDVLKARKMENVIKGWNVGGHSYVLPIYVNPMMYWWRKDLLKEAGFNNPPTTYDEIYELAKKVTIPHKRYAFKVVAGVKWWDRWFDFITLYYAASQGKPYLDPVAKKALFDNGYGKAVANFIYTMFKNKWTVVDFGKDPLANGKVLGMIKGPWSIPYFKKHYPDVYKNIVLTPPPVPEVHKGQSVYTFADTKGMVMFKTTKNKEAAWEFVKWVFSDPAHDALWIKLTNMPPAREDLLSNSLFAEYFKDPIVAAYAKYVGNAVPTAITSKTVDVQEAMTQYLIEPLMYLKATPFEALKKAKTEVEKILKEED